MSKAYKYYQPNRKDLKDKYGDCVIRALTKATDREWMDVFDELVPMAREFQCMPNSKVCYESFLKSHHFVYTGISNKKGSKRPTVEEFAKKHNKGTYVLVVANHLVACVDGHYFDTWDCGYKSLYGFWELKMCQHMLHNGICG